MERPFHFRLVLLTLLVLATIPPLPAADYEEQRHELLDEITEHVRRTSHHLGRERLDERVLEALATVPRHAFVPESVRHLAYENRPLPIGHGQTISQPYIVAIMTDLLELEPGDRVFELGTGSGYQAAILDAMGGEVYSIEIVEPLAEAARERLARLGHQRITLKSGDGYYGWDEHAPFDAIVVTAAASHVPPPLLQQLKPGGRMVIPVGSRFLTQQLLLIRKEEDGTPVTRQILPVTFVPLTGAH